MQTANCISFKNTLFLDKNGLNKINKMLKNRAPSFIQDKCVISEASEALVLDNKILSPTPQK